MRYRENCFMDRSQRDNSGSIECEGFRLPVAVLLDNVRSMYNVGAFFRVADGVGLQKLCLCGITAHPPKNAISKTALGGGNYCSLGAWLGRVADR